MKRVVFCCPPVLPHAVPCLSDPIRSDPFRFVPLCSVPLRSVPFRSVLFRSFPLILFRFISICFVPFRSIRLRSDPIRSDLFHSDPFQLFLLVRFFLGGGGREGVSVVADVRGPGHGGRVEFFCAGVQLHADGRPANLSSSKDHFPRYIRKQKKCFVCTY